MKIRFHSGSCRRSAPTPAWIALSSTAFLLLVAAPCCGNEPTTRAETKRIELAIAAGTRFLIRQQQTDGTWRSKTYGLLKDGTSLTPLVLSALPPSASGSQASRRAGMLVLAGWTSSPAQNPRVIAVPPSPAYVSALCLEALARDQSLDARSQRTAWRDLIASLQLDESNGWSSHEARYGGWGYAQDRPIKPEGDLPFSPLSEPNLSATVFALEGLVIADALCESSAPARERALQFVMRCQNWNDAAPDCDARFFDGGFHFMPGDEVRNKPGVAGIDSAGQTRFVSYGSATSDGLRGLLLCGLKPDHPRVVSARNWLIRHFADGAHPGAYPDDRKSLQPSLDFYYAASVTRALRSVKVSIDPRGPAGNWAVTLSDRLLTLQREDGSWSNPAVDVREDDPLIATPLVLIALQGCLAELAPAR